MKCRLSPRPPDRPQVRDLRPDVPEELASVVQRMMAKRPEDRYQIPLLVVAPLRRYVNGSGLVRLISAANGAARPGSLPPAKPPTSINLTMRLPDDP